MIDLSKKALPDTVEVDGRAYRINTDFQYFIAFSRMSQEKHSAEDYDFFYTEKIPRDRNKGLRALAEFAFPKRTLPRSLSGGSDGKILDYTQDADYIYSAFRHCYGIDLMDSSLHLHWYAFSALLNGLKDTKLNDIIGFRMWTAGKNESKEYREQMTRLKEMWRIEEELTEEEKSVITHFDSL